jgi:capsular exopolysaccharide synthesis family protein
LDLQGYLRVLRKRWKVILVSVVLAVSAGGAVTAATPVKYEASAQLFVALDTAGDTSALAQGNTFAAARVQSYTSIATSPAVLQPVIDQLRLGMTVQQLAAEVVADAPLNKVLINIHVTDHSPQLATNVANAVAEQFSATVAGLDRARNTVSVVKLTVTHPAEVPNVPVAPRPAANVALALFLGMAVGFGIALLREALDNTVKSVDLLQAVSAAPVLGIVPVDRQLAKSPISFRVDPYGARAEAFRQLRTNLQFVDVDAPPRVIAVTSALPGEGKSQTSLNLAASLAEAGHRVCLIEADLRRPSLAKTLGIVGAVGFTSVLIGQVVVEQALQDVGENLSVLTSGPIPPNPSELIASVHSRELLMHLASRFEYVIIDTPPLLPVADGAELATIAEATIFVVRAGRTTKDQVTKGLEVLARVGRKPVGVILSMASLKGSQDYGYYTYSYSPERRHGAASRFGRVGSR